MSLNLNRSRTKLFCAALLAFSGLALAQAPGGVSGNLTLWLKADNMATITGSPVQTWASSGGSATGYSVTQSTAANRPTLINGATNYSKFNYNPTIKFDLAQKNRLFSGSGSPDLLGSNGTAIVITSQEVPNGSVFTYYSGSTGRYQLKPNFRFQTGLSGTGYTFDWGAPTEYSLTSATIIASSGCASTAALRKNSIEVTTPNNKAALYNPSIVTGLYLGANNTSEFTNSSVAEVILFNSKPTVAEMDRIETYLAIKYGITRGGNSNAGSAFNYIASDGTTTIWNKTVNTGFNNDIAGIGRDDNSGLSQKQSISVNNGEAVTISLGNAAIPTENVTNTNTFSNNISFLTWGNNGLANTFNKIANKPAGIAERLDRVWKTQTTNFSQLITFGFETSQITGLGNTGTLCLLFDDDGVDLSNAVVATSCSSAINPTGSRIEFKGLKIPAGKPYFTLARIATPTAITSNNPCVGDPLNFTTETLAPSTTYDWTGPNGFISDIQNPSIASPTADASGTYSVTITNYGCSTVLNTTTTIKPNTTPTFAATAPICAGESLSALPTTSNEGTTGTWSPALDNSQTTTYTFTPASGQCSSANTMTITVNPSVKPTFAAVNPICSGDSLSALPTTSNENLTGTWSPALDNSQTTTYTFTPDAGQCADTNTLTITVNPTIIPTFAAVAPVCMGDSLSELPTTSNEGVAGTWSPAIDNTLSTIYTFTPSNSLCTPKATMNILVNPIPNPQVADGTVCFNSAGEIVNAYTIDTGLSGSQYQFIWTLQPNNAPIAGETAGTYVAKQVGNYTVEVLDSTTGCHSSKTVHVSEAIPAEKAKAIVSNYFEDDQIITVEVIGNGNYLYELDNSGVFQTSNVFHNAAPGEHTVKIIDSTGCTEIVLDHILIIGYPHFFTPNGDGYNETWNITSLQNQPNSEIFIFDRYGKLLKQLTPIAEGWDGTYNGHPLPASDYWFTVTFTENDMPQIFKAHFTLKR